MESNRRLFGILTPGAIIFAVSFFAVGCSRPVPEELQPYSEDQRQTLIQRQKYEIQLNSFLPAALAEAPETIDETAETKTPEEEQAAMPEPQETTMTVEFTVKNNSNSKIAFLTVLLKAFDEQDNELGSQLVALPVGEIAPGDNDIVVVTDLPVSTAVGSISAMVEKLPAPETLADYPEIANQ